jgi:ubiquinone/menaquinone biosynthesis C-methylase UbiE
MLRLHKQKGLIVGVDLSEKMLEMSSQHNQFCLIQADACNLPVSTHSFNRIFCSYVLEILPPSLLPGFLSRAYQVLSPNGRMVLLSLAEGMSSTSRLVMSLWKKIYKINPMLCGGCIPLDLGGMAQKAGLPVLHREILIQMAIPSEIVVIE